MAPHSTYSTSPRHISKMLIIKAFGQLSLKWISLKNRSSALVADVSIKKKLLTHHHIHLIMIAQFFFHSTFLVADSWEKEGMLSLFLLLLMFATIGVPPFLPSDQCISLLAGDVEALLTIKLNGPPPVDFAPGKYADLYLASN